MAYFLRNLFTFIPVMGILASCGPDKAVDAGASKSSGMSTVFAGTYTKKEGHVDGKAAGIYTLQMDTATGLLQQAGLTTGVINPSFLALSPDAQFLYAVSETGPDVDTTGYVYSFAIEEDSLRLLNRQPSHSFAPCHLSVHPSGKFVFVANYVGGVVCMYPVQEDGSLGPASDIRRLTGSGPNAQRQEGSHPHAVFLSPDGQYACVPDLGTDRVMIFLIDPEAGKLNAAAMPFARVAPGSGPRHMVFHPNGRFAYVINELSNTITAFRWDAGSGRLDSLETVSSLPGDFSGTSYTADIHLTPDGRFLYGSNRGHNSLAIFGVDQETGRLTAIGHEPTRGDFPRNFALAPDGRFLYAANQNTDNIAIYRIEADGKLRFLEEMKVPSPVCLLFK